MKNEKFSNYVELYFGEDAKVVTDFFKHDIPEDTMFRNEKEFINKMITVLHSYCNLFKSDKFNLITIETEYYWLCRDIELPKKIKYCYNKIPADTAKKLIKTIKAANDTKVANKFEGDVKAFTKHLKTLVAMTCTKL